MLEDIHSQTTSDIAYKLMTCIFFAYLNKLFKKRICPFLCPVIKIMFNLKLKETANMTDYEFKLQLIALSAVRSVDG